MFNYQSIYQNNKTGISIEFAPKYPYPNENMSTKAYIVTDGDYTRVYSSSHNFRLSSDFTYLPVTQVKDICTRIQAHENQLGKG
jgi:hypothetical protein